MNESIYSTKRTRYAVDFRLAFHEHFHSAITEGRDEFEIPIGEFDAFIISRNDNAGYEEIPEKGSKEWPGFRNVSNHIRHEMNEAAMIGCHGHPPFRVDYKSGRLIVRLLNAMARITFDDAATSLKTTLENKNKNLKKLNEYLRIKVDDLPMEYRSLVMVQHNQWDRMCVRMAREFNDYIDSNKLLLESALSFIHQDRLEHKED